MRSVKPKAPPPTRGVQTFYRYANWAELWDKWYLSINERGTYKYRSILAFAKAVVSNREQRLFLEWFLGPKDSTNEYQQEQIEAGKKKYYFVGGGPQDWFSKRENHGWYTKENIRLLSKSITQRGNALEKMAAAGDEITLQAFLGSSNLLEKLDQTFQGRFFIDELNWDQNLKRAQKYIELRDQLLSQLDRTQKLYALAHGVNYDDMEGFSHFVAATLTLSAGGAEKQTGMEKLLSSLTQMTLTKAAKHQIKLPGEIENKVIDVVAEQKTRKGVN